MTLTIRSLGAIFDYAAIFTYVPSYQHLMTGPSMGLYTAYTHTGTEPDVTGEPQGAAQAPPTPRTLENATTSTATVKSSVNSSFANDLKATGSTLQQSDAYFLAECYDAQANQGASWIVYPSGMSSATIGTQIIAALDALVTSYASSSSVAASGWGGNLGAGGMGDAVRLAWPLISSSMSTSVPYGGSLGTTTRQNAWSTALRASIDYGRYNRQTIGNQSMDNAWNIYCANRALLLVNPANALNESEAQRYLLESAGVNAWLGNDQASGGTDGLGGGPVPTYGVAPYGPNWYMCTTKGTTKDGNGFVGSDYGEQGPFIYHMGLLTGNSQLLARGVTMTLARCQFRYPSQDSNGYFIMMGTDPIGVRNNDLPSHYVYMGRGFDDDFLMASQGASAIGNACLGYFQEGMNDGQIVRNFDTSNPYLPGQWAAITAMAQTGVVLPTASGQPDYAWADEQNMVVAAKHGEERFYTNMYWRQPGYVNSLAKVFHLTPTYAHLADVMVNDVQYRPTGVFATTGNLVDWWTSPPAPDNPSMAYGNLQMPVAWRSDLSSIPANNRDGGRGTGYTLRYGNWLVGMNASYTSNYTVKLSSDFTSATDMISGKTMSGPVSLAPQTTVVFYLPTATDPNPPPARVLTLQATGSNNSVLLSWYGAGSATRYNVLRSTTSGGPYTVVANGVTGTTYTDTTTLNGTTYYYVLQSVNATGVLSGNSPETSAVPVAAETAGLTLPWSDLDIGTSTGGSTTISNGTFTLKSGPGDVWNSADGLHYAYQPMSGDGVVTARVLSESSANSYAKAGLMIRDSLAAGGSEISIHLEPVKRVEFDQRTTDGNSTSNTTYGSTLTAPYWVRLVRSGAAVTGYASPDGVTWTQVGSATFSSLPLVAYVGLDVAPDSSSSGQANTAAFDNVGFPLGASAAPSAPTALTASSSASGATLNWAFVNSAASYNILRSSSASGPFTTVATGVATNSYTDYGAAAGTYYYEIVAVDSVGSSLASSSISTTSGGAVPAAVTGLTATASNAQVALAWNAASGATSYTITRATAGGQASIIASSVTAMSYTDTTATNGTLYYYGVEAINANGQGQGAQTTALPPGSIPSPWQTLDIGGPQPGGAGYSSGTFTLVGSGSDIWNTSDQFRYAYQSMTGNGMITARVDTLTNTNVWNKVGVMFRNTLDANSAYYAVFATESNGMSSQYRSSAGASAAIQTTTSGLTVPYWVRIIRVGSSFSGYISPDGVTWSYMGSQTITMNATVTVGLIDTAETASALNTATFDNVSVNLALASGGTATASASASGYGAANAFDGISTTKWYNGVTGGTAWLQYQFASGVSQVVNQYQIISAADTAQRDPSAWQFQGSTNGTTWTTLNTQASQVFANRGQANLYTISSPAAYSYYRLNVTANAGGSGYGVQLAELTFLTPNSGSTTLAPLAPASLAADWATGETFLSWPAANGATSYNVGRATVSGGPYTTIATGLTGTTYTDTSVTNGTTYFYVVAGVNSVGTGPNSPEDNATPLAPPTAPAGLTAAPGDGQATLSWNAVSNSLSYDVFRATSSTGSYVSVNVTSGTSYVETGLSDGTTYYYVVTAANIAGQSPNSSVASVQPLNIPLNVAATAGNAQVVLSWTAAYGSPLSYNAYRSTTSGSGYTQIATGLTTTGYTDTGASNGTTYYYVVTAVYSYGEGPQSAQVSAKPMPPIPAAPGGLAATGGAGQVSLSWSASTYATSYNVGRSTTNGGPYTVVASPTGTSYADTGLANSATYYYVVSAANLAGTSPNSTQASATTTTPLPGTVGSLTAQANSDQVTLTWSAASNAVSYTIGRSLASGGPYTTLASGLTATTYVDTNLVNGTSYYYVVAAVNSAGSGSNSSQVSATPLAQSLYWDAATGTSLVNGSGSWDTGVTSMWSNSSSGSSSSLQVWLSDDSAYFQTGGALTASIASGTTIKVMSLNQAVNGTAATLTGGTLQLDSSAGITNAIGGGNGTLTINSALLLNTSNLVIDNETTNGTIVLNGTVAESGGSRTLVKTGAGTLQFGTAANTFSGGVVIDSASRVSFYNSASFGSGPLNFNAGTSLSSAAQIYTPSTSGVGSLANNLVFSVGSFGMYSGDHTIAFSGNLSGVGTFGLSTGTHAANVTLTGTNAGFSGSLVYFDNGVTSLLLGSPASGSAAANWTLTGGSATGIGASVAGNNVFALGEVASASGVGRLYNNQSSGVATFQIGDATTNAPSFGGVIADGTAGGKVAVLKVGTDTEILAGANTYTGGTTINGGVLLVNGSLASGGAVTVNTGATLEGTGTINGSASLASGGAITPGNAATTGTLAFTGGLTLNTGGVLNFGLGGTASSDQITVGGGYTSPASSTATINVNAQTGFGPGAYTLISGASSIAASSFTLGSQPVGYTYALSASGGTLTLTVTSTPAAPSGLAAQAVNSAIDLTWSASTGAASYSVLRSTTNGDPYAIVTSGLTATSYVDGGLTNGTTYYYVVTATNASGPSSYSNQASATPANTPIVDSWLDNDIGSVNQPGSASYSTGTFTLNGSGSGVAGTADSFDFVYQTLAGDGTIIARVASMSAGESGVLIRETLDPGSSFAGLMIQQGVGAVFSYRTPAGTAASVGGTTASIAAPYWLKLSRYQGTFTAYTSPEGTTWTQIGTSTDSLASSVFVGLAESSTSNGAPATGTFTNVAIVPTALWASQDIGTVPFAGASYYSNGVATINGSGSDIGSTADQFRYTYMPASGNCDITAQVTSIGNTASLAKAGVMIRASLATGAANVSVFVTPGSGVSSQWRAGTNGATTTTSVSGPAAPYWVRVVRGGNTFTTYDSPDGTTWTKISSATIVMPSAVYIGLPVCSHNSSGICTAVFDNITADP